MSIFSIIFMEKGGRKCPHALSAAYTSIHLNHFFSLIHASFRFLLWFPHWFVSLCHTFLIQCQLFHDRHSLCVRFFLLLRFYIIENTVNLVIIYLPVLPLLSKDFSLSVPPDHLYDLQTLSLLLHLLQVPPHQ